MRPLALAPLLLLAGCGFHLGVDNDTGFGRRSDGNYSSGFRVQRNLVVADGRATVFDGSGDAPDEEVVGAGTAVDVEPWLDLFALGPRDGRTLQDPVVGLAFGQSIFTPEEIDLADDDKRDPVIRDDRPYAGWLYVAAVRYATRLDDDDARRADTQLAVELDLGVTGEPSLAEQTQEIVHEWTDSPDPQGWQHQIAFEPGVVLSVTRRDRLLFGGDPDALGADVLGHVGGALGNIRTQAEVGTLLRVGWNLPRDFGATPVPQGMWSTPGERAPWWALHAGAIGRWVVRDISLDGNSFRDDGHSVPKEHAVGETRLGAAFHWAGMTLAFTRVKRSREFTRQDRPHRFGSLTLGFASRF